MTHRLTTNYAKNYCNRTLTVKFIVENVVTCFLGGHSVEWHYAVNSGSVACEWVILDNMTNVCILLQDQSLTTCETRTKTNDTKVHMAVAQCR